MLIKRMKKNLSILLSSAMLLGSTIPATANEITKVDNASINQSIDASAILEEHNMNEEEFLKEEAIRKNLNDNARNSDVFSDGQVKLSKVQFQLTYGTDDEYKTVIDKVNVKVEVNGALGILKTTEFDENKNITSTFTVNYFDTLENLSENAEAMDIAQGYAQTKSAIPARPSSLKTTGPDKANLIVAKGTTRDTITAYHIFSGASKRYTKDTNDWYSGHTKGYYDYVIKARNSFTSARSKAGSAGQYIIMTLCANYISQRNFNPSVTAMTESLRVLAAGTLLLDATSSIMYVIAYLGNMLIVDHNYTLL